MSAGGRGGLSKAAPSSQEGLCLEDRRGCTCSQHVLTVVVCSQRLGEACFQNGNGSELRGSMATVDGDRDRGQTRSLLGECMDVRSCAFLCVCHREGVATMVRRHIRHDIRFAGGSGDLVTGRATLSGGGVYLKHEYSVLRGRVASRERSRVVARRRRRVARRS